MSQIVRVLCVTIFIGSLLAAPHESNKHEENESPLKLLPVPRPESSKIDAGLNRPSPINPEIPSEPRPADRILDTKVTKADLEHHNAHKRQVLADTEPGVPISIKKSGEKIDLNKKPVLPVLTEERGAYTPNHKRKENAQQSEHVISKRSAQVLADTEPGVPIPIKRPGDKIDLNKKPTESPVPEQGTKGAFTPHLIHKEPLNHQHVDKEDTHRHDNHKQSKRDAHHEESKSSESTPDNDSKASRPQILPFGSDHRPLLNLGHRQHNQDSDNKHEGPLAAILPFGHRRDEQHTAYDDKKPQNSEPSKRPVRHTDNAPGKEVAHAAKPEAPKPHQELPVELKPIPVDTHHQSSAPHAHSKPAIKEIKRDSEQTDSHHQNQSPSKSHSQPSIKEVNHNAQKLSADGPNDGKKSDQTETHPEHDTNHSPVYVHPIPVSQIIKNSAAVPITHA